MESVPINILFSIVLIQNNHPEAPGQGCESIVGGSNNERLRSN